MLSHAETVEMLSNNNLQTKNKLQTKTKKRPRKGEGRKKEKVGTRIRRDHSASRRIKNYHQ